MAQSGETGESSKGKRSKKPKQPSDIESETRFEGMQNEIERRGLEIERLESEKTALREALKEVETREQTPGVERISGSKLNKTLLNINKTLEKLGGIEPEKQPAKTLSLSFEEYQNYLGRVSAINQYIREQFQKVDYIDLAIVGEIENLIPGASETYRDVIETFKNFNAVVEKMYSADNLTDFYDDYLAFFKDFDNYNKNRYLFTPLPNINPEIKKREALKNLTLPGTNNVIFTKLKNTKKTSYDSVLGDYIRVDIPKAIPSKLRYNEKDPQNPFHVTQGTKTFVFNNIEMAKNFCLSGGVQADFINAKNAIDFDKKYKNTYVPSYVYR